MLIIIENSDLHSDILISKKLEYVNTGKDVMAFFFPVFVQDGHGITFEQLIEAMTTSFYVFQELRGYCLGK